MALNYGIYGSRHRNQGGSTDRNDWLRHYEIFNITKDTEIINFYNNLDQYAKDKIDRQLIDLTNAKKKNQETTLSRFVQSVVQLILDSQKMEMQTVENLC